MKKMDIKLLRMAAIVLVVVLFASCKKYKKEIEQLNLSKDSIQMVVDERNDVILDYVGSMNEIQQNLDSIKQIQNLVNMSLSGADSETNKTTKVQIIDDIALIHNLLNQNKDLVAALQKKLKASNLKSVELEQMIQSYVKRIEAKDAEILLLNDQLAGLKINISNLNVKIEELAEESKQKSAMITAKENEMNTAYYCFGSKDELIANNVVEKTGGFLGIGKTLKIKSDFNHDYFNKVDQRDFSEVILMAQKAKLLSFHPDSSYHYTTNDESVIENLIIDKPEDFWKVSKFLVLLVE